jgi:hypothetical protein
MLDSGKFGDKVVLSRKRVREPAEDFPRISGKRTIPMGRISMRKRGPAMTRKGLRGAASILAGTALLIWTAGCKVHVEKGSHGEDKNVQVETPFGGVHVNTDQTTAADLGLPVYPGAEMVTNDDKHKSADIHVGFGEWELRIRAVSYGTPDKQDQVTAFYKKALGRYGDVIACQGDAPIGTPTATSQGLTCNDEKNVKVDSGDFHSGQGDLELKAGSRRHQHIVGFENPTSGGTRFALVALDLPAGAEGGSGKSD